MKSYNRSEVKPMEDGGFQTLPLGGYVAKITNVVDNASKEYLAVEYDIAEGEYAGYHAETYQRAGFWGGKFNRSYGEKSRPYFDGFLKAIENSNPGYAFDWNERSLIGKLVGIVTREREYVGKDSTVKVGQEVDQVRSVDKIRSGDFKIRKRKPLSDADRAKVTQTEEGCSVINDEELPF